jgi:hypothetical protein
MNCHVGIFFSRCYLVTVCLMFVFGDHTIVFSDHMFVFGERVVACSDVAVVFINQFLHLVNIACISDRVI